MIQTFWFVGLGEGKVCLNVSWKSQKCFERVEGGDGVWEKGGSLMYNVSQKIPSEDLWQFFQNCSEFFNKILYAYYEFLSTLDY